LIQARACSHSRMDNEMRAVRRAFSNNDRQLFERSYGG
jgi:hypothetical protein